MQYLNTDTSKKNPGHLLRIKSDYYHTRGLQFKGFYVNNMADTKGVKKLNKA